MAMKSIFSNVKCFKVNKETKTMRGWGSVVIGDIVEVNFTVKEGKNGLFVSLPSHSFDDSEGNKKYANDVKLNKENYAELQKVVLAAFEKAGTFKREEKPVPAADESDGLPF